MKTIAWLSITAGVLAVVVSAAGVEPVGVILGLLIALAGSVAVTLIHISLQLERIAAQLAEQDEAARRTESAKRDPRYAPRFSVEPPGDFALRSLLSR